MNSSPDPIKKFFQSLPGIGPRQAQRFLWTLVDSSPEERAELAQAISLLDQRFKRCEECFSVFSPPGNTCALCADASSRDKGTIMVVERDNDLISVERSGVYRGLYHVLGSLPDPLENMDNSTRRMEKLFARAKKPIVTEVIVALPLTKLGDLTSERIRKKIASSSISVTTLARGISSGVELEYADEWTLSHALRNRT